MVAELFPVGEFLIEELVAWSPRRLFSVAGDSKCE